jgi:uncharacterized membrane protein YedE/YeeE
MHNTPTSLYVWYAIFGTLMGVTLSMGGFSDFEQVHKLFLLQNIPLLLVFVGAIALSMLGFFTIFKNRDIPKKVYNSGTVPGSIMFGIGWAMTGACPSIALVQLGEGKLAALLTISGILAGVWIYRKIAAPTFQLDTGVCGE